MDAEDDPGPTIGLTGARFGGASRRKAKKRAGARAAGEPVTAVISAVAPQEPNVVPDAGFVVYGPALVGLSRARAATRFGQAPHSRRRGTQPNPADLEEGPIDGPSAGADPVGADPAGAHFLDPGAEPSLPGFASEQGVTDGISSFVRPYVLTRGRTRSPYEFSIETLVSAVPMAAQGHAAAEHQAVITLCQEPRSVAEIAALLRVPLGVARVILGDLVAAGAVAVHRTAGVAGPDLALMERVLSGLRRL
ncbi:DUF742 domain-containing protein [Pseudonocardia sp.]|uniref:DUF742 domain-containing protein n=1 Tax=Pseudonocardia sp. TaxID=60912 RepID=UPI0031FC495C